MDDHRGIRTPAAVRGARASDTPDAPRMRSTLTCASGTSHNSDAREAGREAAASAVARVPGGRLALVFASAQHDQADVLAGVVEVLGRMPLAGGSSAGEISTDGYATRSVVVAVLAGNLAVSSAGEEYAGAPGRAAARAARSALDRLPGRTFDAALVFCTSERGEGVEVVAGLEEVLGAGALLFGGGTGYRQQGVAPAETSHQYLDGRLIAGGLVVVLLDLHGGVLKLATSVSHGLQPISQPVVCTRTEGPYVYEIDGEDIFAFYEKYLGRRVEDVGQLIFTYPLLVTAAGQEQPLVRVPYFIERQRGRIGFFPAGPVAGQTASLAHFSKGEIVRACRESAYNALVALGEHRPRLVLAVSCGARQLFLGARVAEEARILKEVFGTDVPIAGFYSGAEIAPHSTRAAGGGGPVVTPSAAAGSQIVAQTFCLLVIGDRRAAAPRDAAALSGAPRRRAASAAEAVALLRDEVLRLRGQIRESEELLEVREQVLLKINRENIEVSRRLREANARLAEMVADYVLGRRVGRYVIEAFLGAGGGGNVYRARSVETDRPVALKLLPKATNALAEKRFRREVDALSRLDDRHLVRYIEAGLERPMPYLAMSLVEGLTLEETLAAARSRQESEGTPCFPLDGALRFATGVARGLAAAHARRILHRDLKPANVIVDREGEAVVIDFGLARDEGAATVTVTGEVIGTVPYFSPEHLSGRPRAPHSDVYQWGLLVHEMLTGTLPYPSMDGWASLMERFERGVRLPRLPGEPLASLARLAEACLDPTPRRRPASGTELVERLAEMAGVRP